MNVVLIHAICRAERLAALRTLAIYTLAVLGGILWVGLNFPGVLPMLLVRVADGLFALIGVAAIVNAVRERQVQRLQRQQRRGS